MPFSPPLLFRTLQVALLFLAFSFQGLAQAPSFAWAKSDGGTGQNHGDDIAVDKSGNSYVTGWFNDTVTFGNTTLSNSGNNNAVFIVKYDSSGNVLWAKSAGGNGHNNGSGVAVDGSGNCYVTGWFHNTAHFGSITLTNPSNLADMFIAKYDPTGNVLWVQQAGGTDSDGGWDIAIDVSGNSYVVGDFSDTATFGGTTLSSSGDYDVYIAKFDPSGNVLWVQQAGGTARDAGWGIAVDSSGSSYVTGWFSGTATFGTTTLSSSGSNDLYIAKYDASGNLLWAKSSGGTSSNEGGNGIAVDGNGNSYVTGPFNGTATFGSTTFTTNGSYDVFIAKYDTAGNVLWAQQAGGTGFDAGYDITVDNSGNSYVTGPCETIASFGSTTLYSNGSNDIFIAKYDASGNVLWAQKAGGTGFDDGWAIAIDINGNSHVTGSHFSPATFGSITLTSNSGSDMFVCKLSSTTLRLPSEISAPLPTYPNPFSTSFQLSLPGSVPATVVLTDVLGREVHRQTVEPPAAESTVIITPAAHLPAGVYGLQILQGDAVRQGKVLKQ